MTDIMTAQHLWVMHTITPVEILQDEEGNPVVFVDPDARVISEDNAVYGCDRCNLPMFGNVGTSCKGVCYDSTDN